MATATYQFKPDQDAEIGDVNKVILKTLVKPEKGVIKEVTVSQLEGFLANMTEQRDKLQIDIDAVTAEIAKIKTDLKIEKEVEAI